MKLDKFSYNNPFDFNQSFMDKNGDSFFLFDDLLLVVYANKNAKAVYKVLKEHNRVDTFLYQNLIVNEYTDGTYPSFQSNSGNIYQTAYRIGLNYHRINGKSLYVKTNHVRIIYSLHGKCYDYKSKYLSIVL